MRFAWITKLFLAVLGVGLLASCAPAETTDVAAVEQAASADVINYVDAMYKKFDPCQQVEMSVGPYDGTGFRPGGRAALLDYMSGLTSAVNGVALCDYIDSFQIGYYFTDEASRARNNFSRDWQLLVAKAGCGTSQTQQAAMRATDGASRLERSP